MTSISQLAAMFATRQLFGQANPSLLAWSEGAWNAWLKLQRNADVRASQPLVLVANLCSLDDLVLHIGVKQLLSIPSVAFSVILVFPTEAATRLAKAQARREEWHELVRMVASSELPRLIDGLSFDSLMVAFTSPVVLERQSFGRVLALLGGASEAASDPTPTHQNVFIGRGRDFQCSSGHELSVESLQAALLEILQWPVGRVPLERAGYVAAAIDETERSDIARTVEQIEGGIDVPGLRNGGELVVTVIRDADESPVIVRHRGDLLDADAPLQIRMPVSMLTVAPQTIRVECRNTGVPSRDFQFNVPPAQLKTWMLSAFLNRGGGGNSVIRAFAQGTGCRIAYAEDEPVELQDIPVVWGVLRQSDRILAQAKREGIYFFYIDHAYFNRGHGKTYRITRNGYEAGPIRDCPDDRISELGVGTEPWRTSGREIIVCPPTDYFMQAHGCPDWLENTLATLKEHTDRPIRIRTKPKAGEAAVPLAVALKKAHALVTHSSNVAIEAACLGTPVFVDEASAAAPVALTDLTQIEDPVYPDRERWLAHLGYNQFGFDEIADGRAWQMLLELEERAYV